MTFIRCLRAPISMMRRHISLSSLSKQNTSSQAAVTDSPQMPPCEFQPQTYKGPSFEHASRVRKENLTPAILTYYKNPVMVHQGHMQWLWDNSGKRYLDLFGGIVTVSVGHCHPKVTSALEEQIQLLWHTTNIYLHPKIHEYAERLTSALPGNLKVAYFVNSGSEANDLAMLMARMYTGRYDVLSLRNAYHGASPYLMGLTSLSTWRYQVPSGFGVQQSMNPDPYRGPWGGKHCRDSLAQPRRHCNCETNQCEASDMYFEQLEDSIRFSTPKSGIAGFFAESIQGVGGTIQFPKNYLNRAFDLVREKGGVCISDEVQTGFGRTGEHYWGFEAHGVQPDIVTMAKGIGNGFPLAAVVTTPEIAAVMGQALHFNTYGGNPMACAVGTAVMDAIDEDGCQQISDNVGSHFIRGLEKLRDDFTTIGDVRGKGLMIGCEMVTDQATREPMPAERVNAIWETCKDMGVLLGKGGLYGNVFRIKPPMCVTMDDADFALAVFRKTIEDDLQRHTN